MTEELGIPVGNFNDQGEMIVTIGSNVDEMNRPMIRAESRDCHDTTAFTTRGDRWVSVIGEEVGTGDDTTTEFSLANKEIKNLKVYLDGVETSAFTLDKTTYDASLNEITHFCRGVVTFDEAPSIGKVITADYEYGEIGTGAKLVYDQALDGASKIIEVCFIDPIHIKDGLIAFEGGELDSIVNVAAICPQYGTYIDDRLPATGVYGDDNGNIVPALGDDKEISRYVVDQIVLGTCHVGTYFNVEARSGAMPPGYKVRLTIDAGSATTLKLYARLEINRQRNSIK
jgi:hypothetical protein